MLKKTSRPSRRSMPNFTQQGKEHTATVLFGTARDDTRSRSKNDHADDDAVTAKWIISEAFSLARDVINKFTPAISVQNQNGSGSTDGILTPSKLNKSVADDFYNFIDSIWDTDDDDDKDNDDWFQLYPIM